MNTVENSYQEIAHSLIASVDGQWQKIIFQTNILKENCSRMTTTRVLNEAGDSIALGFENGFKVNDAVLFLRDDLLATTGDRIWGMTFTLYPDGKFKIEYDYNKPEGYEETDETISLDEALLNLPMSRDQGR